MKTALRLGVLVGAIAVLAAIAISMASAQNAPAWIDQDENWATSKQTLQAFGERFETSEALYEALKRAAGSIEPLTWQQMGEPAYDWSGIYTRTKGGLQFDPDMSQESGPASAKLTPAGQQVLKTKAEQLARTGGEYDPISDCRPPGTPRWFTEPFLHEFIVTPAQTWLINEMVNDVRRVYTDGRDHTPAEDAYSTWNGDSIGFWDAETLVVHTKYLLPGQYQRGVQPNYSDQTTVVERWHKVDARTLQADVWVFDAVNLSEPWYTRQSWTELTNDDKQLRIRYWDCRENPNNAIITTDAGTSQFPDFTFVPNDGEVSSDPAVKQAQEGRGGVR
ncbi:MAG TPA: hypothetical protein VM818_06475 [Vicinamibacterales bacterium]|nr:hypothetical protein [Vicinamibacterales bacterium]